MEEVLQTSLSDNWFQTAAPPTIALRPDQAVSDTGPAVETLCLSGQEHHRRVYDWEGNVYMEKTCLTHANVKERISQHKAFLYVAVEFRGRGGCTIRRSPCSSALQCGMCICTEPHPWAD